MNLKRSALIQHSAWFSAAVPQGECLSRDPPGHFTASCAFTFPIDYCLSKGGRVFTRAHLLVGLFVCQQDYGESNKWISTKLLAERPRAKAKRDPLESLAAVSRERRLLFGSFQLSNMPFK